MERRELRQWARPTLLLLPHEDEARFLDLFWEMVQRVAEDVADPLPSELLVARAVAADLWRYDREANDAEVIKERVYDTVSFNESRANLFREVDDRIRLRGLHVASCKQSLIWLDALREATQGRARGNVIPLRRSG